MIIDIDFHSRVPVYEQIKQQILEAILMGELSAGEQIPSIRELAQRLGVNVNTVKRVFSDLERDDVIRTVVGRGSFVAETALNNQRMIGRSLQALKEALRAARSAGISHEQVLRLLEQLYTSKEREE
ncbi:MAG: GntR family transcriptional regulator [Clostridiales bacterium]|nr:GntR family transcriptional regulator [Clostridiales bacterium]